jgi:NAD(P)-dependent dehydrogenase (short-subunit alcohol dehydrogenase family)
MLQDKVAIVTGAGSGIGKACAVALAAEGAAVITADIDAAGVAATAKLITAQGGRAHCLAADVTSDADMAALAALAFSQFGRLDIAVNAAGGGSRRGPLGKLAEDDFDMMIGLNLKGTFLAMRHQLARLAEQGQGGSVINIASTAGVRGVRNSSLYSAAKHGVIGLTRCAALDYAEAGIRVNAVCPGAIDTPQFDRILASKFPGAARADALASMKDVYPLGRVGAPQEVADMVVWLAGDRASYVTGQALVIDGGFTA